jgi:hypothetical protein
MISRTLSPFVVILPLVLSLLSATPIWWATPASAYTLGYCEMEFDDIKGKSGRTYSLYANDDTSDGLGAARYISLEDCQANKHNVCFSGLAQDRPDCMDYDAAYDADQQDAGAQPQAAPAPPPEETPAPADEPTQDQPAADVFQNALQAPPPAPVPAATAHKDEKKFGNGLDAWTTDDNGGYVFHIFNGGPKTVSCRLDLSYMRESTTGDKISSINPRKPTTGCFASGRARPSTTGAKAKARPRAIG